MVIIFSIPSVQTKVAKRVTDSLNETYGTDINIQRIGLNWRGQLDAREVYIADHHKDTLIYAKELQTNILSFSNLIKGDLSFGNIDLTKAKLYVKTYKNEEIDNLSKFAALFDSETKSSSVFKMYSDDVSVTDSHIMIIDENSENPVLFSLWNVTTEANTLKIEGPEVFTNITSLSLDAERGFSIKNIKTKFAYTLTEMRLEEMVLETEQSIIEGDIKMIYGEEGYTDFVNRVVLVGNFKNSKLATNDLNGFYNEFGPNQIFLFNGDIEGTLNNFNFKNGRVSTGDSYAAGNFYFKNVLEGSETFNINLQKHNVKTSYYDLRRIMPRILGDNLPVQLKSLGAVKYEGNTQVTAKKLITAGVFKSKLGSATTDLLLSNYSDTKQAQYDGTITLQKFNLGKLTDTSSLGEISADLKFDGKGFTQKTVDTRISGTISSFSFQGYTYQNISVKGKLKDPVFNGDLVIDDPNVKLDFNGLIDVSEEANRYDFDADVRYAELNKLNLFKRDSVSVFAGKVSVDMYGNTIDNVIGKINFQETFYQNETEDYYFDDFNIVSSFNDREHIIDVNSPDIIDGRISGKYLIEDIPNLFINGIGSIYANYIPTEVTTNQYINYEFTVYNKIVEVFVPQIELGENSKIKGAVSSDESKFKLDFKSPEILLFNNYLSNINIQVDNDNPLFNTYIEVDSVYTGVYDIIDFSLINKTYKDTLYIRSEFKGGESKDDLFNMSLFHTINPEGKSVVGVKKSDITYKDNVWFVNKNDNKLNKVTFDDNFKSVQIDSLVLNYDNGQIAMAGVLRDSTYKDLKVKFTDVNIGDLVPPIDSLKLSGNTNGSLTFLQENGAYYPNSSITIDNVTINDTDFGDLNLKIAGNENLTKYNVNTSLTNNQVKSISATGEIDVATKNPQIDLDIVLNEFNLAAFSPFGGDVVTNIRGLASGTSKVSGNYKEPDIEGRLNLSESGLKIPYLNIDINLSNATQVVLSKNLLEISETEITDSKYDTKGLFTGNVTHKNFSEWELDFDIEASDKLLVLDTPPDEDELYYGTAFISGNAEIYGPTDELIIKVFATTEEGTTFKIPLSDTESIGDDSFIKFLSPEEKQARISGEKIVSEEVKGLTIDFDLDINDKAEVEVVIDKVNNSTLKGRGAGTLLIRLNTLGKFNMWGEFTVIEGLYDFRYSGLIQKKIGVVPGGNINWDGEPERARLNISAKYQTEANPSVLLDNPSFNRKIPVEVLIDLTGEIIQPDLNFRIDFPRTGSTVKSELEFKLQGKEEREKQAIFLLATGGFVNDNLGGANIAGTLADRVSGLVNELFADEDNKFIVGVDFSQGNRLPNAETADQIGLTLQTQINERILINGKVGVPIGGAIDTAIAGDIEVQWLINADGTLRMNFFNRQADIQFIGEDQIFEQGLGMSYSVDFDTFSELIFKLFGKKVTKDDSLKETPTIPNDNGIPPSDFNNKGTKDEE